MRLVLGVTKREARQDPKRGHTLRALQPENQSTGRPQRLRHQRRRTTTSTTDNRRRHNGYVMPLILCARASAFYHRTIFDDSTTESGVADNFCPAGIDLDKHHVRSTHRKAPRSDNVISSVFRLEGKGADMNAYRFT